MQLKLFYCFLIYGACVCVSVLVNSRSFAKDSLCVQTIVINSNFLLSMLSILPVYYRGCRYANSHKKLHPNSKYSVRLRFTNIMLFLT